MESALARVEARTARMDHWRTSDQKLRLCAAALWAAEATFHRVKGCDHLPLLIAALDANITPPDARGRANTSHRAIT